MSKAPGAVEQAIGEQVGKRPEIAAAWIFGSVARGDAAPGSDLDVAVLLKADRASDDRWLYELAASLERHSPSGRVDILVLGAQGPVLRHRVLREGKLVYDADPDARIAFEAATISEYLDWKPTHEIAMRVAFAGLRDRFARGAG
jgi:uncharacterized protein